MRVYVHNDVFLDAATSDKVLRLYRGSRLCNYCKRGLIIVPRNGDVKLFDTRRDAIVSGFTDFILKNKFYRYV